MPLEKYLDSHPRGAECEIQEAVQPPHLALPAAGAGCPQCQELLHLAYATPVIEGTLVAQESRCHTCRACWHDVYTYCDSVLQSR